VLAIVCNQKEFLSVLCDCVCVRKLEKKIPNKVEAVFIPARYDQFNGVQGLKFPVQASFNGCTDDLDTLFGNRQRE